MMEMKLPILPLLLLISFASVNAVLYTPALPNISVFFNVSSDTAQSTVFWYLIGYTFGQLAYGPVANRYGRKPAIYFGVVLQIISSLLCAFSATAHSFSMLVIGRLLMAIGAGVGLKMTFTIVNECREGKHMSALMAYLMLAFAVTPGLAVALGGFLNEHYSWPSCFIASAIYGFIMLFAASFLPETLREKDYQAFHFKHLIASYAAQFTHLKLIAGGVLMGLSTCFVYVFAAIAPFIAINEMNMTSARYGLANLLPPLGLILGSLSCAQLVMRYPIRTVIKFGIIMTTLGTCILFTALYLEFRPVYALFLPMILVYFGVSHISSNASSTAMSYVSDKAHGSAVMNFINMGSATLSVLLLSLLPTYPLTLPIFYGALIGGMLLISLIF